MPINSPGRKEPSKLLIISAFAAIYIIWGSTYIAIMIAIKEIPPMMMAGSRFLIAGVILLGFLLIKGDSIPDRRSVARISFSGLLMLLLGTGAVAWVEQYISTGLAAMIVATLPLWFVTLDRKHWKENFSNKWTMCGLIIGFVGVLTLFTDKDSFSFSGDRMKLVSFFVLIVGTIAWAIGSLYSKYVPVNGSTGMKAAVQMIAAGLALLIVSLVSGEYHRLIPAHVSYRELLAVAYLISFGSLVGYMAYVWLLSVRPPALVGTYAYVNPVVAVFLGWIILGERVNHQQMIALVVILSGVILVNISKLKSS